MVKSLCVFMCAAFVIVMSGCAENKTRVGEGAGIGGVLGAGVGAIMGYQSGHPMQGAAIGAAVGGLGGAAVGSQIEKPSSGAGTTTSAASTATIQQVVNWTQEGLSGDEIIARINAANASYALTADDLNYLKTKGVSQRVIDTMQAAK